MTALRSLARALLLTSFAAGLPFSLASQNATPPPTLRVTTNLVFLDVTVVNKKGQLVVTRLNKNDFTITVDGKLQHIFSFDPPVTGATSSGGKPLVTGSETVQALKASTGRKLSWTILVLDLMNTPSKDSARARDALRTFLNKQPEQLAARTKLMALNNTSLDQAQANVLGRYIRAFLKSNSHENEV